MNTLRHILSDLLRAATSPPTFQPVVDNWPATEQLDIDPLMLDALFGVGAI